MSAANEIVRDLSALVGGSLLVKAIGACVMQIPPEHGALREHCNRPIRKRDTLITRKKAGDLYEVVGTGNYFKLGFRNYKPFSLQTHVNELEAFAIPNDNEQIKVHSAVSWGLKLNKDGTPDKWAAYRMLYKPKNEEALVKGVTGATGTVLREVVMDLDDPHNITANQVYDPVVEACGQELYDMFGVELRGLYLFESAETMVSAIGKKALGGLHSPNGFDNAVDLDTAVAAASNGSLHVVQSQG